MELMEQHAAHDILVISDSDVRVTPDYLRSVALPFSDARVGGITCLYRGVAAEGGLWARLEAVGMSVEMTAGVPRRAQPGRHAVHPRPHHGLPPRDHPPHGRLPRHRRLLRRRFHPRQRNVQAGAARSCSAITASTTSSSTPASRNPCCHQVRWMKSTRFSRPKGHFGTALTFSMPFGILALAAAAATHHLALGIGLMAWALLTRLAAGHRRWQLGCGRQQLAQPAGPLSRSRPHGLLLLGGQLHLQPHLVARPPLPTPPRRQDAAHRSLTTYLFTPSPFHSFTRSLLPGLRLT